MEQESNVIVEQESNVTTEQESLDFVVNLNAKICVIIEKYVNEIMAQ
jgi:hypothetical protein